MFRKMLALSLLGILVVGAGSVAWGTASGDGFLPSLAAVLGVGEEDGGRHERDHDDD